MYLFAFTMEMPTLCDSMGERYRCSFATNNTTIRVYDFCAQRLQQRTLLLLVAQQRQNPRPLVVYAYINAFAFSSREDLRVFDDVPSLRF